MTATSSACSNLRSRTQPTPADITVISTVEVGTVLETRGKLPAMPSGRV